MPSLFNKFVSILLIVFVAAASQAATVSGYNFHDLNNNGIDDTEPRLPGFSIVVKNLDGIAIQVHDLTDVTGSFKITDLPWQKYIVCEVLPALSKWITTTPQCIEIELGEVNADVVLTFGNRPKLETDIGCTRAQNFWSSSTQGDLLLKFILQAPATVTVGANTYDGKQVNTILDQPVAGNALVTLAHQLITAKVNVLAGASGTTIAATITNADAAIGPLVIPPQSTNFIDPKSKPGISFMSLAATLEKFNNGLTSVPKCN